MKTTVKSLTLLSVLIIFSLTLAGQKNLILMDLQPLLAFDSEIQSDLVLRAERSVNEHVFYVEDRMELKDWMIQSSGWNTSGSSNTGISGAVNVVREPEPGMEEWMLQPFSADRTNLSEILEEETDPPLILCDWMICCSDWKIVRL